MSVCVDEKNNYDNFSVMVSITVTPSDSYTLNDLGTYVPLLTDSIYFSTSSGVILGPKKSSLYTYPNLPLSPSTATRSGYFSIEAAPKAQNTPEIERGSIVDRSGFPLAVQTNFYHVGVSVKNLKDNEKINIDLLCFLET